MLKSIHMEIKSQANESQADESQSNHNKSRLGSVNTVQIMRLNPEMNKVAQRWGGWQEDEESETPGVRTG